jgi:Reverse transcriptase (RNA-dependent DNA polymerase)
MQVRATGRFRWQKVLNPLRRFPVFNVLPFGVKNGPSIFARMMNLLLGHMVRRGSPIGIYFDNITIGGKTVEEHFQLLEEVLQVLQDNSITLSSSKAKFFRLETKVLGFLSLMAPGCVLGKSR